MGNLQRRSNPRTVADLNAVAFTVFQKQVTAAGTPEKIHAGLVIPDGYRLVIKAESSNTGTIQVADSSASADDPTIAFLLAANESLTLNIRDASLIWVDTDVSGDGVECLVEQD